MSKIGSFLTLMVAISASLFKEKSVYQQSTPYQPQASLPAGEIHVIGHGQRHIYGKLPRKRFYQEKIDARKREHEANVWELNQEGIIWTPVGLFWKTRELANFNNLNY
jgi:hypothetical protein